MKVSLNSLRELLAFDLPSSDELVEKIGAQLGAVEEVIELGEKYKDIVIVKVADCQKLDGSDHLSLCLIDDGGKVADAVRNDKGLVQVVCGAPNVHANMLAVWLPPGNTVPSSVGTDEPFVLETREIRGQKSNGMLASPKELALGDNHDGIMEIIGDYQPGDNFAEAFGLKDDVILDIENKMFTHRPDCFGALGVARELAGIQQQSFKSPDWYRLKLEFPAVEGAELPLTVKNELPDLVPRFTALAISDVKVGPTPAWLQAQLAKVGQKSINNIVDYTNFLMLETGQPLHAYDYDKLKALSDGEATIVVRHPKPGEKITLLGGKEVEPPAGAIMIAADQKLIGIGGIMGGAETEVGPETKNIILECANFNMYSVRRTCMTLGLFTDAATRFTKGQSPLQNLAVLTKIADEIVKADAGHIAGHVIDDNHLKGGALFTPVKVTADFINHRLGLKLSVDEMKSLLQNVEFKIELIEDELTVSAPFWRTDIELPEDIVEEVGRLYGYDKLPLELPKRDLTPEPRDPVLELKAQIRNKLAKAGANEVLTYSFVHGNLMEAVGQDASKAFQLGNALSPDLQYLRPSLVPSLLDKVHPNIKAGYDEFALFEIGKVHGLDQGDDEDGLPKEFEFTGLVVAAADKLKKTGSAYYQARKYLNALIPGGQLEFKPVGETMQNYAVVQPYDLNRAALVSVKGGDFLGIIGEFKPGVARKLKLPKYCAGFEIDTEILLAIQAKKTSTYTPLPRFPKVTQDITLQVLASLTFRDLYDFVLNELLQARDNNKFELLPIDIYWHESNPEHKNVTLRLQIASYERTLTDVEINKILDKIAAAAKSKFSAKRI